MGQPFSHPLRVRYAECDRQEVVFNAHYLTYFDVAMTELWRAAFGGYQAMMDRGYDMVVAEANIRFLRSAKFDDELALEVAVTKLGDSSIVTRHRILREDELLIEGMMRHVLVDIATLRKATFPDWARSALAPWVLDGDAWRSAGTHN